MFLIFGKQRFNFAAARSLHEGMHHTEIKTFRVHLERREYLGVKLHSLSVSICFIIFNCKQFVRYWKPK